jgi:hypothetical protein
VAQRRCMNVGVAQFLRAVAALYGLCTSSNLGHGARMRYEAEV